MVKKLKALGEKQAGIGGRHGQVGALRALHGLAKQGEGLGHLAEVQPQVAFIDHRRESVASGGAAAGVHRCAELGRVHVHGGRLAFPDLPRF